MMKTLKEKITYLFSKINWGASFLDAEAVTIMNTIGSDVEQLKLERDIALGEVNKIEKNVLLYTMWLVDENKHPRDSETSMEDAQSYINEYEKLEK